MCETTDRTDKTNADMAISLHIKADKVLDKRFRLLPTGQICVKRASNLSSITLPSFLLLAGAVDDVDLHPSRRPSSVKPQTDKTGRRPIKSLKILSTAAGQICMKRALDMVVDSVARNYKIFVMPNVSMNLSNAMMVIYDSTTNQWRSVHSPMMNTIRSNYIADVKSSVCVDGLLYLLMAMGEDGTTKQHRLWSYNHAEDSWNDTDVTVDHLELSSPQLIVSDNRLFLGSWFRQDPHNALYRWWSYEISGINLEARSRTQVFELSGDRLKQWVQDFSTSSFDGKRAPLHIKAFGFCKSIIFLSNLTGVSKVYDLSTRSWDLLPRNPLMNYLPGAVMQGRGRCSLIFGKTMNLFLPASTMWEQESEAGF